MPSYRSTILSLVVFYIVSLQGTSGRTECPSGLPSTSTSRIYQNKCYQFVSDEKYWDDAQRYCKNYGGRLVKVDDSGTNSFLVGVLNSLSSWPNDGVWIGLHDQTTEMTWYWIDENNGNERVSWSNWASGHPGGLMRGSNDCARMVRSNAWRWQQTRCHTAKWHYRYICEYKLTPTTTSTTTVATTRADSTQTKLSLRSSFGTPPPVKETPSVGKSMILVSPVQKAVEPTTPSNNHGVATKMTQSEGRTFSEQMPAGSDVPMHAAAHLATEDRSFLSERRWQVVFAASAAGCILILFLILFAQCRRRKTIIYVEKVSDLSTLQRASEPRRSCSDADVTAVEERRTDCLDVTRVAMSELKKRAVANTYSDAEIRASQKLVAKKLECSGVEDDYEVPVNSIRTPDYLDLCKSNVYKNYADVLPCDVTNDVTDDKVAEVRYNTVCFDVVKPVVVGEPASDCGMMDYDMPRPTVFYNEIPSSEADCNIYEYLDDDPDC